VPLILHQTAVSAVIGLVRAANGTVFTVPAVAAMPVAISWPAAVVPICSNGEVPTSAVSILLLITVMKAPAGNVPILALCVAPAPDTAVTRPLIDCTVLLEASRAGTPVIKVVTMAISFSNGAR